MSVDYVTALIVHLYLHSLCIYFFARVEKRWAQIIFPSEENYQNKSLFSNITWRKMCKSYFNIFIFTMLNVRDGTTCTMQNIKSEIKTDFQKRIYLIIIQQ